MGSFIADLPLGGASGLPLTTPSDIRPLYEQFVAHRAEAWRLHLMAEAHEESMVDAGFSHDNPEQWALESARRGIEALRDEDEALSAQCNAVQGQIFALPARSFEDLAMKLDVYLDIDFYGQDWDGDVEDPTFHAGLRMAFDLQELLPDFRWTTIKHLTVAKVDYLVKPRELECAE